ncbi:MAG: ATP-dependent dethiobiotin synthetase BioD [Bacteroides sp.]|nr:ATP-dependent dethiobiotin synthetase BioD [Barnesiella sp.]MBD5323515.1 ATP-dependent dethiobiotin synthetase BioD [Bacteroides sp.]MBD5330951.1 ATP-dependent dethiobiotin synthetase BioD [Bacteroides sp.]
MKHTDKMLFVSGIDTDAGKSYATGWIARQMMDRGLRVATLKLVQTGNEGSSEDIAVHRRIMGTELPEDAELITAPQIFSYPASPHLATRIDGREIDFDRIDRCAELLAERYDMVLIEGAGGLMVPLTDEMLTIEYPQKRGIGVVLVTNGRLGSINHTILSLEALERRGMRIDTVAYNHHFDNDPVIAPDTRNFIARYVERHFPATRIVDIPSL